MPDDDTRLGDGEGLDIAEPSDFNLERDADGDLKPVKQRIPGTDKAVLVRPVVDVEPVADVLEGEDPSDDRVDAVAREHVTQGLGADGNLSDLPDYLVNGVLQAIKSASGHRVFLEARRQQLQETAGMLDGMDPEQVEQIAEIGAAQRNGQQQ